MSKEKIIQLICEFCDEYLDDELKELCIKLVNKLDSVDNFSFENDKIEIWACGIIYAIGQLNFLFDNEIKPFVYREELCNYFSINQQKATLKSRDIRRLLNLKLGNKEFTTEFVLSLNIPESDIDLKRIRTLPEIKKQFLVKRPDDVDNVDNAELMDLIELISNNDYNEEYFDDLYSILRSTFFIRPFSGLYSLSMHDEDNKIMFPVFTSMDKCRDVDFNFDNIQFKLWPFYNVLYVIYNDDFKGILINSGSDNFLVTKEMINNHIYKNQDKINYAHLFFF